ncbi:MAG: ribose 5-phosphate isomerase B [Saprospiraceae bacterium]|nr:ribose 5-phosphate isomerase B [Saprospiraceae bacterium]
MTIAIGCDHAGFPFKDAIKTALVDRGDEVLDFGTDSAAAVDYPDFVHPVASAVSEVTAQFGVLICGSGNGVCMTANKHQAIRAAICWQVEIAQLARQHNNANIVCIPARFIDETLAVEIVSAFLTAKFEGGRHARRVNKMSVC